MWSFSKVILFELSFTNALIVNIIIIKLNQECEVCSIMVIVPLSWTYS